MCFVWKLAEVQLINEGRFDTLATEEDVREVDECEAGGF